MKNLIFIICFLYSQLFAIIKQSDPLAGSISHVGAKAASLYQLQKVANVPEWFCVPTAMFKDYLAENGIDEAIKKLDSTGDVKQIKLIKDLILNGSISDRAYNEIKAAYYKLQMPNAAVRSSGIIEDMPDASFAGIYDSYLNQKNLESVISSIKAVWASVFNERAVFERNSKNIKHSVALTAVIVQKMVDAQAAGTAFTMELATGYEGIEIAANYGLGEAVVSGEVSVDKWLVHPETNRILKRSLGTKKLQVIARDGESGTEYSKSSENEQKTYALDHETVKKIAKELQRVAKQFSYAHIDTEFAIDRDGALYFLQARALAPVKIGEIVLDQDDAHLHAILAKGRYAVPGVSSGKIKVIHNWQDLVEKKVKIEPDDVVVTYVSTNVWTQYMTKFKGIITLEGGPSSHPILLCRERKLPCVIGIAEDDFQRLMQMDGKEVTIDGTNQVVYEGIVQTKMASLNDLKSRFEVVDDKLALDEVDKAILALELVYKLPDGSLWLKKPSYPLDPLMMDIHFKSYDKRAELVGISSWPSELKVIDDHIVERFVSTEKNLSYLSHMTLEACEAYTQRQKDAVDRLLQLAEKLSLNESTWRTYVDIMTELRANIWLGFYFRTHINQMLMSEAYRLKIPKLYLEKYLTDIQESLHEEDSALLEEIIDLAKKLSENRLDNKEELIRLAEKYRFNKNLSFTADVDPDIVLKRVLLEIEKGDLVFVNRKNSVIHDDYFPEDETLRRWASLAVENRILQSNCHHYISRSQWKVRKALLELGQKHFASAKDIFKLSVDEVQQIL